MISNEKVDNYKDSYLFGGTTTLFYIVSSVEVL